MPVTEQPWRASQQPEAWRFDDAFWRDRARFVAVGSCIDGEVQRPFVMHADLQRLVIERFDYPDGISSRFDTERYIRLKNPSIRF